MRGFQSLNFCVLQNPFGLIVLEPSLDDFQFPNCRTDLSICSQCIPPKFSKPPSHTTNPIWPLSQRAGGQPGSSSRSSRAQRGQREHRIVPLPPPLRSFLIRDRADRLFFSKSNKKYHYLLIHTPPDWPRPIGAHMEGGRAALGCGTTARTGGLRHLRRRCLPAEAKKQKVGQRRNRGSRISKGTQSRIS